MGGNFEGRRERNRGRRAGTAAFPGRGWRRRWVVMPGCLARPPSSSHVLSASPPLSIMHPSLNAISAKSEEEKASARSSRRPSAGSLRGLHPRTPFGPSRPSSAAAAPSGSPPSRSRGAVSQGPSVAILFTCCEISAAPLEINHSLTFSFHFNFVCLSVCQAVRMFVCMPLNIFHSLFILSFLLFLSLSLFYQ